MSTVDGASQVNMRSVEEVWLVLASGLEVNR